MIELPWLDLKRSEPGRRPLLIQKIPLVITLFTLWSLDGHSVMSYMTANDGVCPTIMANDSKTMQPQVTEKKPLKYLSGKSCHNTDILYGFYVMYI